MVYRDEVILEETNVHGAADEFDEADDREVAFHLTCETVKLSRFNFHQISWDTCDFYFNTNFRALRCL